MRLRRLRVAWCAGGLLALSVVTVIACRTTFPISAHRTLPEAHARFDAAEEHRKNGRFDEALEEYRAAVAVDPRFTAAHRHIQNEMVSRCRRAEVVEEYRRLRSEHPERAELAYLVGRLEDHPSRQREAFREALRLDPRCVWAHYGLGYTYQRERNTLEALASYRRALRVDPTFHHALLRLAEVAEATGDLGRAVDLYRAAIDIRPDEVEARAGLALAASAADRNRVGLRAAVEAARVAPWSGVGFALVDRLLPDGVILGDLDRIAAELDRIAAGHATDATTLSWRWALTRGRVAVLEGDWFHARELFERALGEGGDPLEIADDLRRAAVATQDDARALEAWRMRYPDELVLDSENVWRERYADLVRVLSSSRRSQVDRMERARVLARVGWLDAAEQEYRRHRLENPRDEDAERELRELEAHRGFVAWIDERMERVYREHLEGREVPSLERLVNDVIDEARERMSVELASGVRFTEFPWMGHLMQPGFEDPSALVEHFAKYGQSVVIGQQLGGPPELMLASPLQITLDQPLGDAVERPGASYVRVVTRATTVGSFREYAGARIGGVALGEWMILDFDVLLDWQRGVRSGVAPYVDDPARLFERPIESLVDDVPESWVGDLGCVARSLDLRAYQARAEAEGRSLAVTGGLGNVFDDDWRMQLVLVDAHERGHLYDFHRFLPLAQNWFLVLSTFVELGLSRSRVEEYLEENAQLVAIAESPWPRAALAQTLTASRDAHRSPPHSFGYHRVTREILAHLRSHRDDYPQLDFERSLVQQLDRLDADEIRAIARRLAVRRGVMR